MFILKHIYNHYKPTPKYFFYVKSLNNLSSLKKDKMSSLSVKRILIFFFRIIFYGYFRNSKFHFHFKFKRVTKSIMPQIAATQSICHQKECPIIR